MSLIYGIDLIGTLVFAISGVLVAVEKKFDLVGVFILGLVTAIGGGTLRDVMIGSTPVGWMTDSNYLIIVVLAIPLCYFFRSSLQKFRKGMFMFDTIGIGLFTMLGINKTLAIGLSPHIALLMGVVSAVFGGVIRDVLSNEVPLIFRKEIYASACLAGGLVYLLLNINMDTNQFVILIPISCVILIRILAVKRNWALPFKPL